AWPCVPSLTNASRSLPKMRTPTTLTLSGGLVTGTAAVVVSSTLGGRRLGSKRSFSAIALTSMAGVCCASAPALSPRPRLPFSCGSGAGAGWRAGARPAVPLARLGLRLGRLLAERIAAHLDRRLERARPLGARHGTAAAQLDDRDRELLRAVLEAGDELSEGLEFAREREPDGDLVEGLDRLLLHHLCALHRDALLGRERVRPL